MSHKILIINNYDSFTYNLYQLIGSVLESQTQPFGASYHLDIIRNDDLTLEQIKARNYTHIVISPGAGSPDNLKYFGICSQVILELGQSIPVLGICLGMQGICHYFGGQVVRASNIMHGKTSTIKYNSQSLFKGISQDIQVMRYHSLACADLPDCLIPLAWTNDDNELMGLRHRDCPIFGLQFHPESFATEFGFEMIKNFLDCNASGNDSSSLGGQSGDLSLRSR